jgi:hypothetical protein
MECYLVCSEFHCEESESSGDGEPAAKRARSSDVESDMDSNQYTPPPPLARALSVLFLSTPAVVFQHLSAEGGCWLIVWLVSRRC